jgi:acetolactate synthase-1/2/3 large subunit
MFAPLAKWAAEIDDAARIPEYIVRAFRVALSGRAGPVVLSLPEDMLSDVIAAPTQPPAAVAAGANVRPSDLRALGELLARASKPLLVVGNSGWTERGREGLMQFARNNQLPIIASFRRQDIIDNRDANYCGHLGLGVDPKLAERLKLADVIVSIGSRLGENTTNGYTLLTPPVSTQTLVHVHPDPNELGRVYQPRLAIACGVSDFGSAIADLDLSEFDGGDAATRSAWLKDAREAWLQFTTPEQVAASADGFVSMSAVVGWLSDHLPHDAILCNGAGNYTAWVHRFFRYKHPRTELAPISGAMGYGVPAGVAAALRFPNRTVVAFAGDGCFMMYPQELATAVQHNAKLIILVVNNGIYGTIRMHQERRYPGRIMATDLINPDMVALAQSFGAFGEREESTEAFAGAFQRARDSQKPALLDLRVDPAQISPTFRLPPTRI